MLHLSESVVVLDCPALVAGSYTGHVPVRAVPVELPYQATTDAVQRADVAGQPDSDADSQVAAANPGTLRCKRKRRARLAEEQLSLNAGEAAANRRHAAIQPMLQSAVAVFQQWLSKQDVQRLPDALRNSNALPHVNATTGAALPGPACPVPATTPGSPQQAASSAGTPARESDLLDLLALAELKAVLKPKFRFLAPAGEPEPPGHAWADPSAARGATDPSSLPLACNVSSGASTASGAQHCSKCLSTAPPTCKALSAGASARSGAQHCLCSQVLPPVAPRSPVQTRAVTSASAWADDKAGAGGRAQGCNLFDVLISNECVEERKALAFQTHVIVPPRARFLLSDVTRLRPLLPGALAAHCGARCRWKSIR